MPFLIVPLFRFRWQVSFEIFSEIHLKVQRACPRQKTEYSKNVTPSTYPNLIKVSPNNVFQILFRYNRDFLQNSNGPVYAGFDFQRLFIIELPKVVTINKNLPYLTLLLHVSKVTYLGNKIQMLNDFSNATRFMVPRHDAQRRQLGDGGEFMFVRPYYR